MSPKRTTLLAAWAAGGLLAAAAVAAAPVSAPLALAAGPASAGRALSHGGGYRPSHPGGRPSPGWSGHRGHWDHSNWGWGLGLAIGIPWALGWYEPWWGPGYYPPYAYGPVYRGYAYRDWCAEDEDCLRERMAQSQPAPPTTQAPPAVPGEAGTPTQRPLHLNYCDSAKAWFPQVRACPEGWRFVAPQYDPVR